MDPCPFMYCVLLKFDKIFIMDVQTYVNNI